VESIGLGGHPGWSTTAYSLELRKKIEATTRESISWLSDLQREMEGQGRRLRKEAIEDTISQWAARHNLLPSFQIKQHLKRKSTKGIQGQSSTMESIEPYMVSLCYSAFKHAHSINSFTRAATMQFQNNGYQVQGSSRSMQKRSC
jgi:hypothetical protein